METIYDSSPKEKQLVAVGRDMMDFSEEYGKIHGLKAVTDEGMRTLNELSHVGSMLTRFGTTYGPKFKDFSDADRELITRFIKKEVDILRK